ncbi:MAG: radical SAM protein [Candidatus Electrothrix sp. AS4_5]|nr:radical SAM protein [Candidatus Electrothrix gigas]
MNLLLTTKCNRICKYCFAKNKLTHNKNGNNQFISLENVRKVIKFLKKSEEHTISLLGGEPTLHPQFTDILTLFNNERFAVNVFTNGIISSSTIEAIKNSRIEKINFLVNTNEQHENRPHDWDKIIHTFDEIPYYTILGFTIYRADFNADFLIELCNKYNLLKHIRLGIAQPVLNQKNNYLSPEYYKKIGKKICTLSDLCIQHDISLWFDCGFTLCMFDQNQLELLKKNNVQLQFSCGTTIDVGPDLTVWNCFPLSCVHNTKLKQFTTTQDIRDYYKKKLSSCFKVGSYSYCQNCKYFISRQCAGGCTAHIYRRLEHAKKL